MSTVSAFLLSEWTLLKIQLILALCEIQVMLINSLHQKSKVNCSTVLEPTNKRPKSCRGVVKNKKILSPFTLDKCQQN